MPDNSPSTTAADLAPAAIAVLLKAWDAGDPTGAVEVVQLLGYLVPREDPPKVCDGGAFAALIRPRPPAI